MTAVQVWLPVHVALDQPLVAAEAELQVARKIGSGLLEVEQKLGVIIGQGQV